MAKKLHDLDPKTLSEWMAQERCVIIDVREPFEHAQGYIRKAKLYPVSSLDPKELPDPGDKTVVFYCKAGVRSAKAANQYMALTNEDTYHLACGFDGWRDAAMPIEGGGKTGISAERKAEIIVGGGVILFTTLGLIVHPAFFVGSFLVGMERLLSGYTGINIPSLCLQKVAFKKKI